MGSAATARSVDGGEVGVVLAQVGLLERRHAVDEGPHSVVDLLEPKARTRGNQPAVERRLHRVEQDAVG